MDFRPSVYLAGIASPKCDGGTTAVDSNAKENESPADEQQPPTPIAHGSANSEGFARVESRVYAPGRAQANLRG
jgi:hypothetical protein